ncbi:hypothetical protein CDD81_7478 [Ophiocordyceps australis]|uniref:Disease resistance R13L4/SHOC-2-like LRR domain-containing protein n=1 Tax=Ophiocordyceps australis TaxID=1399860 RepID=A0A2C5YFM9_9HYPO|nr:hypothetical protein CDD81_7478 [Ophiocordyceps australis]
MDRPERIPGLAAPSTAALRGLPENPAQGRRPAPNFGVLANGHLPPALPPVPPPLPLLANSLRNVPSSSSLAASSAVSPAQVIAFAREAMRQALESEKSQVVEASAVGAAGLKSGVTIDLSRKNIHTLPDEVVDIVKDELGRLALSHNLLSSLPARFSECTSLRYLNLRGNQLREFPMPLCDLKPLEILDVGRNQLRMLPNEICRLTSLKVLSINKNQIRELPLCLGDMATLQVLKLEGNPIVFPPREAIQPQAASPPHEGIARDMELTEVSMTVHIKRFLKQYAINGRIEAEATGDESSEGAETPRLPLKRGTSGRFPIKVNGADVPDLRSPNSGSRPPPIPSRSHYRGLSQQNTAIRRPGVMPLTIGNVNERLRSNSETLLRNDRPDGRHRRLGIVSRKASELGTLDETQANIRFSNHYRGLSHGSAMQGTPPRAKSPATPTETYFQRPIYVRRLSVLPERRRESKVFDPVVESAKGILYSVFQIHPMIQMLVTLTSDGPKRSSLEIVFYNTNSHVVELEQEIQKYDTAVADGAGRSYRENHSVHRACKVLVSAYGHVCSLLTDNIDTIVDNGDARYVRTLLMLLYNSIMELRVSMTTMRAEQAKHRSRNTDLDSDANTIRPYHRLPAVAPIAERPGFSRSRNGTTAHNPQNLRVATDVAVAYANGSNRTVTITSATPRSDESLSSVHSRGVSAEALDDDALFDRIFLSLQRSTDIVIRTLPNFQAQLNGGLRAALQQRAATTVVQYWKSLMALCNSTMQQTELLRNQLSQIKLKDPAVRTQASFWNQCNNFVASWTTMAHKIKSAINTIPLPPDTRLRLKPIQKTMKETSSVILHSPWGPLFRPHGGSASAYASQVVSPTPSVPITPQSAALGPALQATVSTTPHSASFAAAFHGNVFDRADALIANPGISMSRGGAVARGHSGFNSMSSISSMSSDGNTVSSATTLSPGNGLGLVPSRINGGKVAI